MKMKFEKTATSYSIEIPVDVFSVHLMGDERDSFNNRVPLYQKLANVPGVDGVEYDGHFGNYVYLTIDIEHDNKYTKNVIGKIMQKHFTQKKDVL